jgi:tetratricopeptide (TPR) repeat protein
MKLPTISFITHIMKNIIFTFFLLITIQSSAQLTFDKKILDCEDKWVVFPEDSDGLHKYGFIYVDSEAGLTFDYSGKIKIDATGKIMAYPKEEGSSMKIPLNPNKILLAIIPESNFEQLKLSKVPDWLSLYKVKEGSIEQLYSWGSIYNAWGEYQKALDLLEKASKINSEYKGLDAQLAYSYNRLNQYKKAIEVLKKGLVVNPTDAFMTKEYIYALAKSQQLDVAIVSYRNSLKICPDKTYVPENAYYILEGYFYKYDRVNFDKWLAETEVTMSSNEQIKKIIAEMKIEITKNKL